MNKMPVATSVYTQLNIAGHNSSHYHGNSCVHPKGSQFYLSPDQVDILTITQGKVGTHIMTTIDLSRLV